MNNEELFNSHYDGSKESLEKAITELRKKGVSITEVVMTVKERLNISLTDADKLVLNSYAFNDKKNESESLRDKLDNMM
jgi:hypothetical protein